MQRVKKQDLDTVNRQKTVQVKAASDSSGSEFAMQINNSPAMVTQRKQLGHMFGDAIQRQEEDEPLQGKFESGTPAQLAEDAPEKPNNTGLPDNLKNGIESLSGVSMDSVKVHYNSSQPAQLNALAYAQGTDIHVAPGQEKHLPHEAWHVVQQAEGRVQPTMQMQGGVPVNDDKSLEREADVMGAKAARGERETGARTKTAIDSRAIPQLKGIHFDAGEGSGWHIHKNHVKYGSNNATRVDFSGRTRRQIGYAWEQLIQANGLVGTKGDDDFKACSAWIRKNL